MYVAIQHTIHDPENFWQTADKELAALPEGFKIVSVLPNPDGKICNCLWEVESVEALQAMMDDKFGPYAQNLCYEVNPPKAVGLP